MYSDGKAISRITGKSHNMFRVRSDESAKTYRFAIIMLLTLSFIALLVTIWVMNDFLREQRIVGELIKQLPSSATASAEKLIGELRWQFRLTALVVLNLIVTFFAMLLLWRAYRSSQKSLQTITALAGDILGSVEQAIITAGPTGIVTSINDRGIELLELGEDYVGSPLSLLPTSLPLETLRAESQQQTARLTPQDFPIQANGNTRILRVQCQPLRNHEDKNIGNVLQLSDVTERRLVDERMRRMERYMGLGSLAAGLHHEIKNPLTALSLHAQLLEEQLEEQHASDESQDMLDVIKTELARVGQVLESFRDFTAMDKLNVSDVDVVELVERQVKLIVPRAQQSEVTVAFEPSLGLPTVVADRSRLEQVLLNLFVNAIEAMPNGGQLVVSAKTSQLADHQAVCISVADQGGGIPSGLRESVFDPYFTTKNEGTGMGLAFCDKIIRQHHGSLAFQCTPSGTQFDVILPINQSGAMP